MWWRSVLNCQSLLGCKQLHILSHSNSIPEPVSSIFTTPKGTTHCPAGRHLCPGADELGVLMHLLAVSNTAGLPGFSHLCYESYNLWAEVWPSQSRSLTQSKPKFDPVKLFRTTLRSLRSLQKINRAQGIELRKLKSDSREIFSGNFT